MKVEVEQIEGCKRRLAVEAPAEVVQQEWERAYGRVQKQARLPGFRKGHVPRSLVKVHFAADVRREVAKHLIPDVWRQAISEARIEPVDEPDLQDVKLEEGAPLSFVAVVEVKPAVPLADYKDVDVQHQAKPVTDADVDAALEHMREQQAQFHAVDRAAAPGDLLVVDYTLALEGQEPSHQAGYEFLVGGGMVLPEIDQAVAGMRTTETREVPLRFADDHQREALRGKSGSATVKVVEVKEKALPALDDDFAKSLGEFETLAALRAEVLKQLTARREHDEQRELQDKVVDAVLDRHGFLVPDALVMRQVAHQIEHTREGLRRQGVDPDRVPWDYTKMIAELRPAAEKAVRRTLLLEAIAEREGIAPSDGDVDAEVDKLAQASQRPAGDHARPSLRSKALFSTTDDDPAARSTTTTSCRWFDSATRSTPAGATARSKGRPKSPGTSRDSLPSAARTTSDSSPPSSVTATRRFPSGSQRARRVRTPDGRPRRTGAPSQRPIAWTLPRTTHATECPWGWRSKLSRCFDAGTNRRFRCARALDHSTGTRSVRPETASQTNRSAPAW